MQIECAKAFVPALKAGLVSVDNKQRILNLTVNITTSDVIENADLIQAWVLVFDEVIGLVDFDYVQMVAVKPLLDMIDRKNPLPKRRRGNRLITSLAKACGEKAFDEERSILRHICAIFGDTNYEIRLDGVIFLKEYLAKNHVELKSGARLEDVYISELIELLNDEESVVRIEAIEASIEVISVMDAGTIEK